MGVSSYLTAAALIGAAGFGACARKHVDSAVALGPGTSPASVEWAGCAIVRSGPRCELGPSRTLTVWAAGNDGRGWTFTADGRAIEAHAMTPMQGGFQMTLQVPPAVHRLSAARQAGASEVWSLAVGDATLHPQLDDLVAAGKRGDPNAAGRLRSAIDDRDDERFRARAAAGYGRIMLAQGRMQDAEPALRKAMATDRATGDLSEEMREGSALIWGLVVLQQRFADARAVLESLQSIRDQFPEGQAWYCYSEGLLAAETDDLRRALASYRTAARIWEHLGQVGLANDAAEDLARVLVVIGRSGEAVSILGSLPGKKDPCAHASLTINRAEALLEAATHDRSIAEARVRAVLAEEQEATKICPDPHRRFIADINAARHALSIADDRQTDTLVARIRSGPGGNEDALSKAWRAEVLGTWWLARGHAREALRSFEEQALIAGAVGLRDERLRAEIGAGEALVALGRQRAGVARFRKAQALMKATLEGIPISEGRGEFLSSHDEGVRHLVDALVEGGAAGEALTVARIARSTEIGHAAKRDSLERLSAEQRRRWDEALERYAHLRRAIEQESTEDWKIPGLALARAQADREIRANDARETLDSAYNLLVGRRPGPELARPSTPADEVEIAFFPGIKDWISFTLSSCGVRARRFRDEALDSNETASEILGQIAPALATTRRVAILAFGRSDRIDWHAVNWRGAPLVATHEVVYRLDLPGISGQAHSGEYSTDALVVSNPTGDLGGADAEGTWLTHRLAGSRVTRLRGVQATRDALLRALPEAALFHFAGHAEFAGPSGSASALILAGGERAQLGDLLALPRLPGTVVLSACRAAASGARVTDAPSTSAMGLAQAFLAAGSRAVVAPVRDVDDAETQAFMADLYDPSTWPESDNLSKAFQKAAVGAVGKTSQSFRLVVQ